MQRKQTSQSPFTVGATKSRSRSHCARQRATVQTEKLGINAVERIFLDFGWIFRRQTEDDYGIDAIVEVAKDGLPTGRLIALQIKSGASYFKKRDVNYAYYGEAKHLE